MTDPTPPPDEPLGDQARARIRAEVLEAVHTQPGTARRWTAPIVAAASVVLVVGATAWAQGSGNDRTDSSTGTAVSTTVSPATQSELAPGSPRPLPVEPDPDPASCVSGIDDVLAGAELAVEVPADDEESSTSFWVAGERFAICDVRGGMLGLRGPLPLVPDLDRSTFRFSFTSPPAELRQPSVGVAGGIVPEGALAYDVGFTFPDGETAVAEKTTDDAGRTWWWLVHTSEADGRESVRVTLSLSGMQHTYTIPWGMPA